MEVLYSKALEFAELTKKDKVFDAYCGIGTISLIASKQADSVVGVEIVKEAIIDAKRNAKLNKIDNVEFICDDAVNAFENFYDNKNIPKHFFLY